MQTYSFTPEGDLYAATQQKQRAYKVVQQFREAVRQAGPWAGQARLELLKAESEYRRTALHEKQVKGRLKAQAGLR